MYIVWRGLVAAWENSWIATFGGSAAFLIFTLFNLDFVRHYIKLSKKALRSWQEGGPARAVTAAKKKTK